MGQSEVGQSAIEGFLNERSDQGSASLRHLSQRAYERGFRIGPSAARAPAPRAFFELAALAPARTPTPLAPPAPRRPAAVGWDEDDTGADEEDDEDTGNDEPARSIGAEATVGTSIRRNQWTFAIERFDIDVIVCRRGGRQRRQPNASVRLRKYLRER